MAYDFSGKKALVTGAGRGIGKEIVKRLVNCKAEVVALDINEENLSILKREIPTVHVICVDLTDWMATRKAIQQLGVIDMLANNAGILVEGSFEEITENDLDRLYAVNVKPIVNVSQVVVKQLKKHGKPGSIVNTASLTATTYLPSLAAYSSSKATVDKLTKTMAVELGPFGIRVNAVNPTYVLTEMTSKILEEANTEEIKNSIPLKRLAEKEDVAASVVFLLSDEAKMVNGTSLYVDGGHRIA